MNMKTVKIGFVGTGAISGIYLKNITELFHEIEIIGVCDLVRERAQSAVEKYNIPKLYENMQELFADQEVDIVLNLTRPYEHYEVSRAALEAGKHVYTEKPLAATFEDGIRLVELAKKNNLMIGGAPDTFLGAGIQTCRKLIDDGYIGTPIGGAAFMICRGHESWHPDPEFYYKLGGGPILDMGPYYVTALVNLLGRVDCVSGMTQIPYQKRTITSQPKFGTVIDVDVPTSVAGTMRFENGALGTIFTSFDINYMNSARLEIYGSEGTLICPDPNTFGGDVKLLRRGSNELSTIPLLFKYRENSRALGLADMAKAIQTGREYRASCEQILHVLEIMTSFIKSGEEGKAIKLKTPYERKEPMQNPELTGILE